MSNPNGVSGTEKVEIVTRDRNQPAMILSVVRLTRYTDYEFEPFSGRLLFRRPVVSVDERLNPVSIRVTYEVDGGGEKHWVVGADGQFKVRALEIGGSYAEDRNPYAPYEIASVNATLTIGGHTTLVAEGARTESVVNTNAFNRLFTANLANASGPVSGRAARVELRHQSRRLQARVFAGDSDPGFDNPTATLSGGRAEAGARAAFTLAEHVRLIGEAIQSRDRLTGGERQGGLVALEAQVTKAVTLEVGVRRAKETAEPAQGTSAGLQPFGSTTAGYGFSPVGGDVDPVTGLQVVNSRFGPQLSAGTGAAPLSEPLDTTALRAKLGVKVGKPWALYLEGEQDVRDPDKRLLAAGGQYTFAERGRIYGRHEFISSLDGVYALNDRQRTHRTVFGVATSYMKGGDLFSEYRAADAISGRQAQAAIGLNNRWTLAEGVRLSTGFERLHSVTGEREAATAASVGLEHTRSASFKGTARAEWRREGDSDSWLSTLGAARRVSADWTMLAKNYFQLSTPRAAERQLQDRLWIGAAYRDQDSNRLSALSRYEFRYEDQPGSVDGGASRRVHVVSSHANYHPSPPWTFMGQYAGKWVSERLQDGRDDYAAHLVSGRVTRDLTSRIDAGVIGSLMWSSSEGGLRKAFGAELGYLLKENMWLSVGWNVTGFSDRDLASVVDTGYTTRGVYLRLRLKFDEDLRLGRRKADTGR